MKNPNAVALTLYSHTDGTKRSYAPGSNIGPIAQYSTIMARVKQTVELVSKYRNPVYDEKIWDIVRFRDALIDAGSVFHAGNGTTTLYYTAAGGTFGAQAVGAWAPTTTPGATGTDNTVSYTCLGAPALPLYGTGRVNSAVVTVGMFRHDGTRALFWVKVAGTFSGSPVTWAKSAVGDLTTDGSAQVMYLGLFEAPMYNCARLNSTAYVLGEQCHANDGSARVYEVQAVAGAGTTAASPPTFAHATVGDLTTDGNITWRYLYDAVNWYTNFHGVGDTGMTAPFDRDGRVSANSGYFINFASTFYDPAASILDLRDALDLTGEVTATEKARWTTLALRGISDYWAFRASSFANTTKNMIGFGRTLFVHARGLSAMLTGRINYKAPTVAPTLTAANIEKMSGDAAGVYLNDLVAPGVLYGGNPTREMAYSFQKYVEMDRITGTPPVLTLGGHTAEYGKFLTCAYIEHAKSLILNRVDPSQEPYPINPVGVGYKPWMDGLADETVIDWLELQRARSADPDRFMNPGSSFGSAADSYTPTWSTSATHNGLPAWPTLRHVIEYKIYWRRYTSLDNAGRSMWGTAATGGFVGYRYCNFNSGGKGNDGPNASDGVFPVLCGTMLYGLIWLAVEKREGRAANNSAWTIDALVAHADEVYSNAWLAEGLNVADWPVNVDDTYQGSFNRVYTTKQAAEALRGTGRYLALRPRAALRANA